MEKTRLGRTGLMVGRSGFGALPIQRVGHEEAEKLLRRAYEAGFNLFDTGRKYSDSEEKIGRALSGVREDVFIATKSDAKERDALMEHIEASLRALRTDYIDIYQLHNPTSLPDPDDPKGTYRGLVEARKKGMIRFLGVTCHRLDVALEAVRSGLYDTVMFPLSSISSQRDLGLIDECRRHDVGLLGMKALSGGLITNGASAFAFLRQYDNLVPLWGIQREWELEEIIGFEKDPPRLDEGLWEVIRQDRESLSGSFCRACGYCLPCPADIPIPTAARMGLLLRRSPYQRFLTEEWREKMERIEDCQDCGQCRSRCPYGLDTPALLRRMLEDYRDFSARHKGLV